MLLIVVHILNTVFMYYINLRLGEHLRFTVANTIHTKYINFYIIILHIIMQLIIQGVSIVPHGFHFSFSQQVFDECCSYYTNISSLEFRIFIECKFVALHRFLTLPHLF